MHRNLNKMVCSWIWLHQITNSKSDEAEIGVLEVFGPQMALTYRLDAISQNPKNSRIPGPNPLPLPLVVDMHASKTLCTWLYKSYVHRQLLLTYSVVAWSWIAASSLFTAPAGPILQSNNDWMMFRCACRHSPKAVKNIDKLWKYTRRSPNLGGGGGGGWPLNKKKIVK